MLQQQIDGKYELLGQLEDEGGAEVYKVRHLFLEEVRLIKVVHPPSLAMTAEVTEAFLREARAVIKLRHPNISQLHDFTIDAEGDAYIVTELIEGLSLEEALAQEGPPPVPLTLTIAQQALRALGYLHRAGMVHRDVSPDKLMLTRDVDGRALVKWVGLGTAQILAAGDSSPAGAGMFPARPRYASPEQFGAGGEGAVDARSDVYSFGVVLYELLTGHSPITGHDPFSLMAGHLSSPPRSFAETDPEGRVPAEVREVVLRALAKKPEERIASADDLVRRLAMLQDPLADDRGGEYLDRILQSARQRTAVITPAPRPVAAPKVVPKQASTSPIPIPIPAPVPPRPVEPEPSVLSAHETGRGLDVREEPRLASGDAGKARLDWDPILPDAAPPPPAVAEPERPRSKMALLVLGAVLLAGALVGGGWWLGGSHKSAEPPSPAVTPAPTPPPTETIEVKSETAAKREESPRSAAPPPATTKRPKPVLVETAPPRPRPLPKVTVTESPAPAATPVATPPPAETTPKETVAKPPAPPGRGSLITGGPGVEAVEVTSLGQPIYPVRARGTGRKPSIKVAVLVDENGNVAQVRIKEGDPSGLGFNEAALEAARRTRFLPATKDGVPGRSWTEVMFEFVDPGT
jgi:eukaryotic-like serine/threonine-protein kinase